MPRKAAQLVGDGQPLADRKAVGVEPRFDHSLAVTLAAIPPLVVFGDLIDALRIESERLADIAQHAARSITDDGGCECRAIAPVFVVDVLNDFFAPLMLEIDINIRRLVALAADEALEQNVAAARI